jgi:uncharacterized protein
MQAEHILKAVEMSQRLDHIIIATADAGGLPHMAAAGHLDLGFKNRLEVTEWFCPGTVANLSRNRRICLVVWDSQSDRGYQLSGEVEHIQETAMLDGFAPELTERPPVPQIQRKLVVRVDTVLSFSHAHHTDEVL